MATKPGACAELDESGACGELEEPGACAELDDVGWRPPQEHTVSTIIRASVAVPAKPTVVPPDEHIAIRAGDSTPVIASLRRAGSGNSLNISIQRRRWLRSSLRLRL